ncbi:MAG: hypothetical protein ACMUHM_03815 [Thermoplasmatota archaeon]
MKKENNDGINLGFMIGSLIAVISALLATLGFLWLLRVPVVTSSIIKHIDGIFHFEEFCCGLTLIFVALTLGGILQANYSLIRSLKKK